MTITVTEADRKAARECGFSNAFASLQARDTYEGNVAQAIAEIAKESEKP